MQICTAIALIVGAVALSLFAYDSGVVNLPLGQWADCRIKGNISENGRIYHVPGQRYYTATRINRLRGERWFCSEAEARSAGWRRSNI
jgi:hypothetical protein